MRNGFTKGLIMGSIIGVICKYGDEFRYDEWKVKKKN